MIQGQQGKEEEKKVPSAEQAYTQLVHCNCVAIFHHLQQFQLSRLQVVQILPSIYIQSRQGLADKIQKYTTR